MNSTSFSFAPIALLVPGCPCSARRGRLGPADEEEASTHLLGSFRRFCLLLFPTIILSQAWQFHWLLLESNFPQLTWRPLKRQQLHIINFQSLKNKNKEFVAKWKKKFEIKLKIERYIFLTFQCRRRHGCVLWGKYRWDDCTDCYTGNISVRCTFLALDSASKSNKMPVRQLRRCPSSPFL